MSVYIKLYNNRLEGFGKILASCYSQNDSDLAEK